MIKQLKLSRLTSPEFYQFMFLVLGIVKKLDIAKVKIKPEHDDFEALLTRLLAALNQEQAYALSKILDELDKRRDIAIVGFAMWIRALTMHPNPTINASAKAIRTYLKTHGDNIANQNLQTETATLTKITNDCKNDTALKAHLVNVKDTEWLAEIEDANNQYISNYQQRSQQMGASANDESFTAVRRLQIDAYQNLVDIIVTRYKAGKADGVDVSDLKACIDEWNATIVQYKQLIVQTQTHKKDESKTDAK